MRALTAQEETALGIAERRKAARDRYRLRRDALRGRLALVDDMLASVDQVSERRRHRLEPELLVAKAGLLRGLPGADVVVSLFDRAYRDALAPIVGGD